MCRFQLAVLALLAMLASIGTASAFSTEKAGDVIKGDASNFTDPDEQAPAFLQSSGGQPSRQVQSGPSVTIDQNAQREEFLGLSQGFDRAYSRK